MLILHDCIFIILMQSHANLNSMQKNTSTGLFIAYSTIDTLTYTAIAEIH